jgi:hypothetical protein
VRSFCQIAVMCVSIVQFTSAISDESEKIRTS